MEFVAIVAAIVAASFKPDWVVTYSDWLVLESEFLKWLFIVPLGLLGWVAAEVRGILFPEGENKEAINSWPNYWELRITCDVALIYSAIFAVTGLAVWANPSGYFGPVRMFLLSVATVGSIVVAASIYDAKNTIREILSQRTRKP